MSELSPRAVAIAAVDPRRLWIARLLLIGWWTAMFVGTHLPLESIGGHPPLPDKLVHFLMFAGLGMLLPLCSGWRPPLLGRRWLLLLLGIAAYATFDELTQIPVGRDAEWLDGVADLLGGLAGLLTAALIAPKWFGGIRGTDATARGSL